MGSKASHSHQQTSEQRLPEVTEATDWATEISGLSTYLEQTPPQRVTTPPIQPHAHSLPLHELAWEDFERLCLQLADAQGTVVGCRRYGRPGQRQDGVDFYARDRRNSNYFRLYQCKRVRMLRPAEIETEVSAFLSHPFATRATVYTICTTDRLTDVAQVKALESARDRLASKGIQLGVWDREDLELRLRDNPMLVERFFGSAWVASFCGRVAAAQLSAARKTTSRRPLRPARHTLAQVRALSEDTARLSDVVAHLSNGEFRLGDGLYVPRHAEAQVNELLQQQDAGRCMAIIGEAGVGKTSLLWHLRQRLMDDHETWLLPASALLRGRNRSTPDRLVRTLDHDDVLVAAEALATDGRPPVVLLDTVDLLLHHAEDRDDLVGLIGALRDLNCQVIISTRPQEAASLGGAQRVALEPYDDEELQQALRRHIRRFYGDISGNDSEQRSQSLLEGVASGLPIRTLCANPLTLRMLFEIYAPHEIPNEISSFALYVEYWRSRVQMDRRVGMAPTGSRNPNSDLSSTAASVGLVMLREGTPALDENLLAADVGNYDGNPTDLPTLIGRGVLQRSMDGTISFFHQTFFEHAAARGLLSLGAAGIAGASQRIDETAGDLFVLPVHEQLLLLAEAAARPVRQAANEELRRLLHSAAVTVQASAIYVYVHRRRVDSDLIREVDGRLAGNATESFVGRFLDVAPNVVTPRLENLFAELALIWRRGHRNEQQRVLDVLARVASRSPEGARRLLIQEGCLETILSDPVPELPGAWRFVAAIFPIAQIDPPWGLRCLAKVWQGAAARAKSRKLQLKILEELHTRAEIFGAASLARQFEEAVPDWWRDVHSEVEALSLATGHLFTTEWLAAGRSIDSILRELEQVPLGLAKNARMNGLAAVLLQRGEDVTAVLTRTFTAADRRTRGQWARIVFSALLRGHVEPNAVPDTINDVTVAFRAWTQARLSQAVSETEGGDVDTEEGRLLLGALEHARLPPQVLHYLLEAFPRSSNEQTWKGELAPFLVPMALAGHQTANSVLDTIRRRPLAADPRFRHDVIEALLDAWGSTPLVEDVLFDICICSADTGKLHKVLTLLEQAPDQLELRRSTIASVAIQVALDPAASQRSSGIQLWQRLVAMRLARPPNVPEVAKLLSAREPRDAMAALALTEGCLADGLLPAPDTAALLQRVVLPDQEGTQEVRLRCSLMALIAQTVWHDSQPSSATMQQAVEVAFSPPTNAGRILLLRTLLDHLTVLDTQRAAWLALTIGRQLRTIDRTHTQRTVSNRFRRPLQRLFALAPEKVVSSLLQAVPDVDPHFGGWLVQSATHQSVGENVTRQLDNLLSNPNTPPGVKESIRRIKYYRQRLQGGLPWSQLSDLWASTDHEDASLRQGHSRG
jgi:hypothetical protein